MKDNINLLLILMIMLGLINVLEVNRIEYLESQSAQQEQIIIELKEDVNEMNEHIEGLIK